MSFRSRTRSTGVFYVPGFPKGVKWLLISNVAVFLTGFFAQLVQLDGPLRYLALVPVSVVKDFYVWQLATYMFLHAGFGHIIWNMLGFVRTNTSLQGPYSRSDIEALAEVRVRIYQGFWFDV